MALGGGCVVFFQSRNCPQLAAVHFAQGTVFVGTNAAVGFAFPSQSHPAFSLPLPHPAPEYTDLGAHRDPVNAQQVVSQAKW